MVRCLRTVLQAPELPGHEDLDMIKRFIREDDGMEMVEWAIVGVVFALAAGLYFADLAPAVDTALNRVENCIADTC